MSLHSRAGSELPSSGESCTIAAAWMAVKSCQKTPTEQPLVCPELIAAAGLSCQQYLCEVVEG